MELNRDLQENIHDRDSIKKIYYFIRKIGNKNYILLK